MKLTTLLIIIAFIHASAAGYGQKINLHVQNSPLATILAAIKVQTGYVFFSKDVDLTKPLLSIELKDASLDDALKACFKNLPIEYKIVDKTVFLVAKTAAPTDPPATISTTTKITVVVKDTTETPIAGVSVRNKTKGTGGVTDRQGYFTLTADPGDVLEFSFVGFLTQQVTVGTQPTINIILTANTNSLDKIVVTALGITKSERTLGYATSTVNGNQLNQAKEPNVASSLEGRVAGLNINTVEGGPGSSARILIRGVSNFSSGQVGPLFVIDGVPMDNTQQGTPGTYGGSDQGDGISSINPDDVESVTVLKGSTASALYGARSSNGVILITTKSGKNSKGWNVEISSNIYLNQAVNVTDFQKDYGAGQHGVIPQSVGDLINNDGFNSWGPKFNGQQAIGFNGQIYPYAPVSNAFGQFYRTPLQSSNTISFSHGGKDGNVRLSFSQTDDPSVMPNSGLKRYSGNLNLHQNITDKLKLAVMTNFLHENVQNRPYLNDFTRNSNFTVEFLPPNISPNSLKPGYDPATGTETKIDGSGYYEDPWFVQDKLVNNTSRNRFITSTSLHYDCSKELYAQVRLGLDYIIDNTLQYEPTGWGEISQGKLENQGKQETSELNVDALIGYHHHFSEKFSINANGGGSIRKNQVENVGYNNQNWVEPFVYTVNNSNGLAANYSFTKLQTNSLYYTIDLNYSRYLTLSTTGRADWYSTVLDNPIFTPSVSGSFLFGDLLNIPAMNEAKLRASYAQTSQGAAPYHTQITYVPQGLTAGLAFGTPQTYVFDPNAIRAYKMSEYELGLQTKFFNSRLGLDITYFSRKTTNELVNEPIDPASGYSTAYLPLGATSNKGVEFELNAAPVAQKYFRWNIDFNFTYVANKLISIGANTGAYLQLNQYTPATGGTTNAGDNSFIADVQGLPLSQIMVYDYKKDNKGNIVVSNGIPEKGNLIAAGSGIPKIYGGINDEFVYKRLSLNFLVDYRFKANVESGTNFWSLYYGLNKHTLSGRANGIVYNGVNEDGSTNTTSVDAQTFYQGELNNGIATMEIFDGSFIKLRQLTFGYDIPLAKITNNSLQSVKISLVGRNLCTILKHTSNFDPESQYSSTLANAGLEGGSLPPVRSYGINLNVKF